MDICARQGHSFEVERIAKARISRLSALGPERDADRAVTQDNLANLYLQQRRNDEAISLLINSLAIFERTSGPSARAMSVCCLYLSRAYLRRQDFERAEFYGRRALESAKASEGAESEAAAITADELAVAVAFNATHAKSAQKAAEAL